MALVMVAVALPTVWLSGAGAAAQSQSPQAGQAAEQTLVWTAGNSYTEYMSMPTTATAGPATIVFETNASTGNTFGMTHTLTFDTSSPGYNHDVSVDIIASPFDATGGRHEVQVNLTPGTYRYYCMIPGHAGMVGELVVTSAGPTDTTPPTVSAAVSGDKNANGDYVDSATVTISATDTESGVDTVEYALDGGAFQAYTAPVSVNQVGEHTVRYRATDKAGNTADVQSATFTVVAPQPKDTTPPTVSAAVSGDKNANGDYVDSATVTISATDTESGVDTVEYALDGGAFQAYTTPVSVNQVGEHTVRYRATDKAGNTADVQSATFTVVAPQPAETPLTVTASSRCMGTSAYVAVTAVNDGDVPATVTLTSPYGTKTVADVAPGKQAYQSFNARAKQIGAGKVTVTGTSIINGKNVTTSYETAYNAISCG
ncbi:chitobiase/beta-hexosaminidase C-terminal domain-containing protein [Microbispora sp. RL4-1S]|uniref:Chitobiase/beta-hexosaminidase C-terminal domain-containing protein n=1 Tax=Microbispora oryzae TaxID=2806554 RepID=A0A940WJG1_9ACTN|nr:Ig-like domain repeat protein [Microbispora oryzae]MBP2706745.1 chitobiase/beta-hexosaminidase C-terminal domain-containing protein [Microbispora oryzae]